MTRWLILSAACVVGLLNVAPYLLAYYTIPDERPAFQFLHHDSELIYLSRIREVTEGHVSIASPVFHEYKDAGTVQQPFGEWLYAVLALGNPAWLPWVIILTKFAFPAVLFVLIVAIVRTLLARAEVAAPAAHLALALFVAWFIAAGLDLYRPLEFVRTLVEGSNVPLLSIWSRMVNPITGGLLLFATLLILVRGEGEMCPRRALLMGVVLGLSSGYIFSFAYAFVASGLYLALHLLYREWDRVKEVGSGIALGLLINVPYLLGILTSVSGGSSLTKNGLFETHEPLVNKALLAAGGIAMACAFLHLLPAITRPTMRERFRAMAITLLKHPWWRFSFVAVLAGHICYNQQLITGKTVWPQHFVQYSDPIAFMVVVGSIFFLYAFHFERMGIPERWVTIAARDGAVLGIVLLIVAQVSSLPSVHTATEQYQREQRYRPVVAWLDEEHPDGNCVALVAEPTLELERFIPAYTGCDLYHSQYVFMNVPEERILHNYLVYMRLRGVTSETIETYLAEHEAHLQDYFFSDWREKFARSRDPWLAKVAKPGQVTRFFADTKTMVAREFWANEDVPLAKLISRYRLDYLIVDQERHPLWVDPSLFRPVFVVEGIAVFHVEPMADTTP